MSQTPFPHVVVVVKCTLYFQKCITKLNSLTVYDVTIYNVKYSRITNCIAIECTGDTAFVGVSILIFFNLKPLRRRLLHKWHQVS